MNLIQTLSNAALKSNTSVRPDFIATIGFEPASVLQLATTSLGFEAGFLLLPHAKQTQVVGQKGVIVHPAVVPQWMMPLQPHLLHQSGQLDALATMLGQNNLNNAFGIGIRRNGELLGALWLVNSLETPNPHSLTVLSTLGQHIGNLWKTKASLSLTDSMLNSLPIGVIATDQFGHIQQINQHFTTQFGYRLADMQNHHIQEFVLPESKQSVLDALEARSSGKSSLYRTKMYLKDGSIADIEVSGHPRFDGAGQFLGAVKLLRDISEELALEQAALAARRAINKKLTDTLQTTREQLEFERKMASMIVQTAQEGFLVLRGLTIEFVNQRFAEMLGYSEAAILGRHIFEFILPEELGISKTAIKHVQPGKPVKFLQRLVRADGTTVHVVYHGQARYNATGDAIGSIGSVRDVSQELKSASRITDLEQELHFAQTNFAFDTGFGGRLETIGGAIGLVQMLAATPICGVIQLYDSMMFFDLGKIVAMVHPKLSGEEAVRAVIQRQTGQFQFIPEVRPERRSLNLDPIKIALELLTKRDEAHAPTTKPQVQRLVLPNAKAAHAFMQGVGGRNQFETTLENNQVVLTGRGFHVVVLQAALEDF
jgi:PAS domain S-box-containing protein